MMIFTLFTLSGPLIGGAGYYIDAPTMFWIGVALAGVNLFMNLSSGVMKFPVLPIAAMVLGTFIAQPISVGIGLGLLGWTLVEGIFEIPSYLS